MHFSIRHETGEPDNKLESAPFVATRHTVTCLLTLHAHFPTDATCCCGLVSRT